MKGSHFLCCTFLSKISFLYIKVWRFGQSTGPYLFMSSPNTGSHFTCRTFLSNFHLVNFKNCNDWKGSHFLCRTFLSKITTYIYIELWRFGQPTRPYLSVFPKTRGHTLRVALFWSKFVLIYSCEGLVIQLDHTCLCLPHAKFC